MERVQHDHRAEILTSYRIDGMEDSEEDVYNKQS